MEKEELEKYIEEGISLNQISKMTLKSLTTIRYWVNKYELKSSFVTFKDQVKTEYGETRFCSRCKSNVDTKNFHQRRGKENGSTYCKPCTTDQTLERMRKLKIQMVDYKGGSCVRCGYNKYMGALEFHHLDPSEKDFNPSHLRKYKFDDRVKMELDKCILVCSNCHREIHHEIKEKEKETL
jgi:hypothetical protein